MKSGRLPRRIISHAATGENAIADAAAAGDLHEVWALLEERLRVVDAYVEQFVAVFPDVHAAADIRFTHAANAIAAFEANNWRADNSPFEIIENDRVDFWIRYFTGPGKDRFERALYRMELHRPTVEVFERLQESGVLGGNRPVILDSGCGTGASTRKLANMHPQHLVIGVDRSAVRLRITSASAGDRKGRPYQLIFKYK